MKTINFDRAKLKALKRAYSKAITERRDQFEFEGNPLLVAYAKYLIEYLETKFPPQRKVSVQ